MLLTALAPGRGQEQHRPHYPSAYLATRGAIHGSVRPGNPSLGCCGYD